MKKSNQIVSAINVGMTITVGPSDWLKRMCQLNALRQLQRDQFLRS